METARTIVPAAAERMDIVVVGHVDHGKSTVIGRLMADTGSLPTGKLEQVRRTCELNARPFEYAFLLDALKNEQAQGITIDTARCFFKTAKRHYIIHDAPGHVEFLKNMVTGAARAEAALLVIDAEEGVRENSLRHGYILSMLGIRQLAVLVNKMDLVGWDRAVFEALRDEYGRFLAEVGIEGVRFIPIAAREGANLTVRSSDGPWYEGPTVLEQIDSFQPLTRRNDEPFRLPVQDVYKFTARGDDRRIIAGTVESGSVAPGDEVVFQPSGKRSVVATIERFNGEPPASAGANEAVGLTLTEQVYVRPGEMMVKASEVPPITVARRFRANVFWMGKAPMIMGKRYKLKIGAARVPVELVKVIRVLDASDLGAESSKRQVDRHDVGEVALEAARPIAFDVAGVLERTSRFVIVDDYDIAGCGTVMSVIEHDESLLDARVRERERGWAGSDITAEERRLRYGHSGKFVVVLGSERDGAVSVARATERRLFELGAHTCYMGLTGEGAATFNPEDADDAVERSEHLYHLGQIARVMTGAGLLLITALGSLDDFELTDLRKLSAPFELFVVCVGEVADRENTQVWLPAGVDPLKAAERIIQELTTGGVLPEYSI